MKAELTPCSWGSPPERENGYLNVKTEKHLCETPGEITVEKEVLKAISSLYWTAGDRSW